MIRFKSEAGEFIIEVKVFSRTKTFRFFRNRKFPSGTVEISRNFPNEGGNGRVVVFAAFCPDGRISNRQIYYLEGLKKISDKIIFVADSKVFEDELTKISDLVCYCEFGYNREYDFGSYKRGYEYALKSGLLESSDELVFCNDSCYGPIYSFEECFMKMETNPCDFWGMTSNEKYKRHIQSYFYVFKSNVFKSSAFRKFIFGISRQRGINSVIRKYEAEFTAYLENQGFLSQTFVPQNIEDIPTDVNKTFYPLTLLTKFQVPLVKVKTFNGKYIDNLEEDPAEVLGYIEQVNPVLARIIRKND